MYYIHTDEKLTCDFKTDLRSPPPRNPGGPFSYDSGSEDWRLNNDCRSEISSGSGYWDGADQNCSSVSLKLWWENLAESDCEGRLVSAVERVTPIQNNIGPPSIRLCLIHPGRGRAARRRTAANSQDAIETREGGWCWTSQTAIGWGPLPKRALRG